MLVNIYKQFFLTLLLLIGVTSYTQVWTLEQCIDSALVNNTQIKMMDNQTEIAALKNKEIKANLIPKVMANGEYKYFIDLPYQLMPQSVFGGPEGVFKEAQFGVPHNINGNLTIQIPLYSAKLYGAIEKTELAKDIIGLQKRKTKEQIYFEVSALYRNAQLLMNKELFLDSSILNTETMLATIIQLQKALLATGTDAKKIALQLSILNAQKDQIQVKTNQVLNGLKMYMGMSLDVAIRVDPIINLTENNSYETKPSIETQILNTQKEMLSTDINALKKSRYIPDVGAVGYMGMNGFGYDKSPNEFLSFFPMSFVGLKVSYPIFNGTVTNKQIAQKNIEYDNLQLQQSLITDKINLEIYNATEDLKIAIKMVDIRQLQIDLAKEIFNEVNMQYRQGIATTLDIIRADNELRMAKQNYLAAVTDCIISDLKLKKLTGNILQQQ